MLVKSHVANRPFTATILPVAGYLTAMIPRAQSKALSSTPRGNAPRRQTPDSPPEYS